MDDKIDVLIKIIKEEESVLSEFLNCLTNQKEYIIQNNIEEFDRTVKEEEEIINRIRDLEQQRIQLVASLSPKIESLEDELTLTRLIEMNLGESSDELKQMKTSLSRLVDRIKTANKVNQYLIKKSLSFIQKNIDWFIDDGKLNITYSSDGRQKVKEIGNLLVDRVL